MTEPVFKSNLSNEKIESNFKNIDFFSGIMSGLEEALAYEKSAALPHSTFSANKFDINQQEEPMQQPMTKERALQNAIVSTEMEGLVVTDEHKALLNKLINHEISLDEAIAQVRAKYHK